MILLRRIFFLTAALLLSASVTSRAQNLSLSTNFVDWGFFGTANLSFEAALSQHFSLETGAKYNPWTIKKNSTRPIKNQQMTGYVAAKYWFWYVYSGWWMSGKAKFSDYTQTGLLKSTMTRVSLSVRDWRSGIRTCSGSISILTWAWDCGEEGLSTMCPIIALNA